MITAQFGITQEPFNRSDLTLLKQQLEIVEILKIHSQQGGFSIIIGQPGVGKSVLREHLENLRKERSIIVVSFSQTLHTYLNILKQLAESLHIDAPAKKLEKELINAMHAHVREGKSVFTVIDEAHLLDMITLRKLRLLFDRFPKKHNLVLLGQPELMYQLSMMTNVDLKNRITFSKTLAPLNDDDLTRYIHQELENVRLGINTFDEGAIELILRSASGNLRLCRNLCYGSLVEACRQNKRSVSISQVNDVLVQPHWRSHEDLIKQQVKS